jgi:hypothetical protein
MHLVFQVSMQYALVASELRGLYRVVQIIREMRGRYDEDEDEDADRALLIAAIEGALERTRGVARMTRAVGRPLWEAKVWRLMGDLCTWLGDLTGLYHHRSSAQDAYRRAVQLLDQRDHSLGF